MIVDPSDEDSSGEIIEADDKEDEEIVCDCGTNRHLKEANMDFSGAWIGCDGCDRWFHADCYNLTEEDVDNLTTWYCNECNANREFAQ